MPIEVELPDGNTVEFPDGTSRDVMQNALARYKTTSAEVPAAQPMPEGPGKFAPPKAPGLSLPEPGMLEDALKSGAAGLARGAIGLAGLPGTVEQLGRMGINYAGRKLSGNDQQLVSEQPVLPSAAGIQKQVEENVTGKLYKPQTAVGRYTNAIGEFAPGMLFPGSMAQRVMGNVVGPAVVSETAGHAAKDTAWEAPARIAGAIAGGFVPNLPIKAYTPVATNPQRQQAVEALRKEGVTSLSAGEVTGNKPLRWLEQAASDIPGSGGRGHVLGEEAGTQFTTAALRRAGTEAPWVKAELNKLGIDGKLADHKTIDALYSVLGKRFDELSASSTLKLGPQDARKIMQTALDYELSTPSAFASRVVGKVADDVRSAAAAGNPMPGGWYQRYRSLIEGAARQSKDPEMSTKLREVIKIMDDGVETGLPQAMRGQWSEVRKYYRDLLPVAQASTRAGENARQGIISPEGLRNAIIQKQGMRNYERGRGNLTELADAGELVLKRLPNSGTPARLAATGIGNAAGAAVGSLAAGAPGAAVGAVLGPVGQAMLARAFMSGPMQRYLGANARMQPAQMNSMQGGLIGGGMAGATSPLEVSIFPPGDPRNNF